MKKLWHSIIWAAIFLAALSAFSCSREMDIPDEIPDQVENDGRDLRTIHFRALPKDSKAQFGPGENGSYPTLWTDNDTEVKISLNFTGAQTASVTPSEDYRGASFSATLDFTGVPSTYKYYVVSPSSVAKALSPSREAWKVSIPCTQTPTAGSVDENAIILAASSEVFTEEASPAEVDLTFSHLTAYGRVSLTGLDLSGKTVQAVELTSYIPLVGDWYWTCEPGADGHELIDYGASSTITINTDHADNVWFGCAPADLSGTLMNVSLVTNEGTYVKLIEFNGTYKLEAGKIAVFSVNMGTNDVDFIPSGGGSSGSGAFSLVTDASSLAAGDEVLIAYTAGGKALGAISSNGNFRTEAEVSISNGSIASEGEAVVLSLANGTVAGTWAFQDGSNYLTSPSSGTSNNLLNSSSITANSSWSLSIDDSGLATVQAQEGTRQYLLYNPSSPRFTCYDTADKSGMKKVSIYRRTSSGSTGGSDPLLLETEYGCYLGGALTRKLVEGEDQVVRSYNSLHKETYTIINPDSVEELSIYGYAKELCKGDNLVVEVNWRQGTSTVHSDSYIVTIVKDEGPKVWLSDGAGNGFIIKK